jgi:hypothetical protein
LCTEKYKIYFFVFHFFGDHNPSSSEMDSNDDSNLLSTDKNASTTVSQGAERNHLQMQLEDASFQPRAQ